MEKELQGVRKTQGNESLGGAALTLLTLTVLRKQEQMPRLKRNAGHNEKAYGIQ